MTLEEIETKLNAVEETTVKLRELINDAKICNSNITKTLILSAIKKYSTTISDFKVD